MTSGPSDMSNMTPEEIEQEQERKHFCRIVASFKAYKRCMLKKIEDKERYVKSLPPSHQSCLDSYLRHLDAQKSCIHQNADIIQMIIKDVENMFENVQRTEIEELEPNSDVLISDLEKVQSTLKHIVRDWSSAGEQERRLCYDPIIEHVEALFPKDKVHPENINILVPGAGLGRLSYEFAQRGFMCQGNEYSLFMLFTSNFVLNRLHGINILPIYPYMLGGSNPWTVPIKRLRGINTLPIYPWVHGGSNQWTNADQLKQVLFPDVEPSNIPPKAQFTMAAGDFLEIYKEKEAWDCIASCFFIDCGNNIVSFIETLYRILKPGGHWVNLGPLLYHYADIPGENSIEPTYEEVQNIIRKTGFKLLSEKRYMKTTYTRNERSMMSYDYSSVFFHAQKP